MSDTTWVANATESPASRFYRTVWRWHFYAGLFVIPFILILAITGSIYLFKPQLDNVMYRNLLWVEASGSLAPYSQQMNAVQAQYPEATITQIVPNIAPNRSTEMGVTVTSQNAEQNLTEQNLTVYVNPYTAKVLGALDADNNFQEKVRQMHSSLMLGTFGNYLVELAACWALVLLLTGLYLWWPRRNAGIWGTLLPRLTHANRRIVWRDLHAVPGFYGIVLVGFLILTGLPWSGFWGDTFSQIWGQFPPQMWDEVPTSTLTTGVLNHSGKQVVPWAVQQLPMPISSGSLETCHDGEATTEENPSVTTPEPIGIDQVIALAQAKGVVPGFSVTFPADKTGVYTASVFPADPAQEATLHIDQYSGELLADVRWQNYGLVPKAVEMGVAIHMGRYWGWVNQLVMLLACVIAMVLSVSGVVLWWQRRPSDRLGAPPLPPFVQSWRVPMIVIAVLGFVFPLVGFSLLGVLVLDYLVIQRLPWLKRMVN
jgi:uncharacterized iron-regulated membrane protein